MAIFVYPPSKFDKTGLATEAKQDAMIVELQEIEADVEAGNVTLSSIDGKVATEAKQDTQITELQDIEADVEAGNVTLTSINGKVSTEAKQDAAITELQEIEADVEAGNATLTSIDGKVSTEAKQDTQITGLANLRSDAQGQLFNIDHDFRDFTYVAAGTGVGSPSSIVLKTGGSGGTTVRTISFTYTTNALSDDVVDTITYS